MTARTAVKLEDDDKEARQVAREARKAKAEVRRATKTAGGAEGPNARDWERPRETEYSRGNFGQFVV